MIKDQAADGGGSAKLAALTRLASECVTDVDEHQNEDDGDATEESEE